MSKVAVVTDSTVHIPPKHFEGLLISIIRYTSPGVIIVIEMVLTSHPKIFLPA